MKAKRQIKSFWWTPEHPETKWFGTLTLEPDETPELELFVESGFTPMEALQTATRNPARYFGKLNDMGTLEPGKLADLVLLDANPLDDIRNTRKISLVVLRGRII